MDVPFTFTANAKFIGEYDDDLDGTFIVPNGKSKTTENGYCDYGATTSLDSLFPSNLKHRKRKTPSRNITKTGLCQVKVQNVEFQGWKFIEDGFTSLLELQWRWIIFSFCAGYFASWIIFGLLYYLCVYLHSDLEHFDDPNWKPCISGISGFTTSFLFSIETQQTIGYGYYHLGSECPDAIILLCFQSIVGVILEGLLVGLVFVKMSRPKKRSATLMFSRNAVISRRDGVLYLMIRCGDMRTKSHLLEARIRAQFISKRKTQEGEVIYNYQQELKIGGDLEKNNKLLLFWPTILIHKIDSSSPLYHITPSEFDEDNDSFEIIVVLEGIVESTGLATQARSSFLPSEILWGHRFKSLNSAKSSTDGIKLVDFALFHETFSVATPLLSAAELDKQQKR